MITFLISRHLPKISAISMIKVLQNYAKGRNFPLDIRNWKSIVICFYEYNNDAAKRGKYRKGIIREKLRVKIDIDLFISQYQNGVKIKQLEEIFNISTPTIYRLIKSNNVCKRRG